MVCNTRLIEQRQQITLDLRVAIASQAYQAVRTAKWEAMKDWQLDEEVKLLLERY